MGEKRHWSRTLWSLCHQVSSKSQAALTAGYRKSLTSSENVKIHFAQKCFIVANNHARAPCCFPEQDAEWTDTETWELGSQIYEQMSPICWCKHEVSSLLSKKLFVTTRSDGTLNPQPSTTNTQRTASSPASKNNHMVPRTQIDVIGHCVEHNSSECFKISPEPRSVLLYPPVPLCCDNKLLNCCFLPFIS